MRTGDGRLHELDVLILATGFRVDRFVRPMAVIGRGDGTRNADVIAATDARIVTIPGQALRNASAGCRMHFYAGFLDVLKTRLALANARLAAV